MLIHVQYRAEGMSHSAFVSHESIENIPKDTQLVPETHRILFGHV